jgi:hypothetical protein
MNTIELRYQPFEQLDKEQLKKEQLEKNRVKALHNRCKTVRIQHQLMLERQRERHTITLVCIIYAAPLVVTGVVALAVELFN